MRRHRFTKWAFTKWNLALAALLAASGCAEGFGSGATASREPGFRATSVRRPALLVRVSVPAELGRRERDRIPENYEAAVVEGLERVGILAVDMVSVPGSSARPLEGLDRTAALSRASRWRHSHQVPGFVYCFPHPPNCTGSGCSDQQDEGTRPCPTSWIRQVASSARKPSTSS